MRLSQLAVAMKPGSKVKTPWSLASGAMFSTAGPIVPVSVSSSLLLPLSGSVSRYFFWLMRFHLSHRGRSPRRLLDNLNGLTRDRFFLRIKIVHQPQDVFRIFRDRRVFGKARDAGRAIRRDHLDAIRLGQRELGGLQ